MSSNQQQPTHASSAGAPRPQRKRPRQERENDGNARASSARAGSSLNANNDPRRQQQTGQRPPLIQPINTGTILSDSSVDVHLIGVKPPENLKEGLVVVSSFLRRHQFLSSSGEENGDSNEVNGLAKVYGPTVEEFRKAQVERQAAGLRTNTSGASASDMQRVVKCHSEALEHGLDSVAASDESWQAGLCGVHARLCPDLPQSGRYRDNMVRASNTSFTRPENVRGEMSKFSLAVKRVTAKWIGSSAAIVDDAKWREDVYRKIGVAALVLFGINDIHPFRDGNGRTARIFMNVTLKKLLGLPFSVIITATQQQRSEYVDAIRECRSRMQGVEGDGRGAGPGPVLERLIVVLVGRVRHAIDHVNSLIESKTRAAAADEEARIARRVRERAAEGQCVICK